MGSVGEFAKRGLIGSEMEIVIKLSQTLRILLNQYQMIDELSVNDEVGALRQKYEFLGEFIIQVGKKEEICVPMILKIDSFLRDLMAGLGKKLKKLEKYWTSKKKGRYLNFLYIFV